MNGHEKRKVMKMQRIKEAAVELFCQHGVQKVTVDEIANAANVSKVTLYKYFESKDILMSKIMEDIYDSIINDTEEIIASSNDFKLKLEKIINQRIQFLSKYNSALAHELFFDTRTELYTTFSTRTKALMYDFYDTGKAQGHISPTISNDTLYAYHQIFNSGLQSLVQKDLSLLSKDEMMKDLMTLYFYGLCR